MLYFIYSRLGVILEWMGKLMRSIALLAKKNDQKQDLMIRLLRENNDILHELRDSIVPDQAVRLNLTSGQTQEQP